MFIDGAVNANGDEIRDGYDKILTAIAVDVTSPQTGPRWFD